MGGCAVGNALEVKEAIDILKGKIKNDLYKVCKHLTAEMLYLADFGSFDYCENAFDECISNGKAYEKFVEFVLAQGGSLFEFENGAYLMNAVGFVDGVNFGLGFQRGAFAAALRLFKQVFQFALSVAQLFCKSFSIFIELVCIGVSVILEL